MGKERLLGLALLLELVQDVKSLSDLGIESLLGVEEVQKLVVVHLEQRDAAPNTPAGSVEDSANLHATQNSATAAAVAEAYVVRESAS